MLTSTGDSASVRFTIIREQGAVVEITTNVPAINHFLALVRLNRSYATWLNYGHDLKLFFSVIRKPPHLIDRHDCVAFMQQQRQAGRADTTINRRLAAVSSLFNELCLLDAHQFRQNPVSPLHHQLKRPYQQTQSLYLRQPERIPDIVPEDALQRFLAALPTSRDRALVLLMCSSCLRVSEVVAIRFEHIECSRRSVFIPAGKGGRSRTTYMDSTTFAVLNRYLDTERRDRFPEVDFVFVALKGPARGHPLTVNAVQHLIRYYAHKCALPQLHPHLFRHTGITLLLQHHMPEPALRTLVGHKNAHSLEPYTHLSDTFVQTEFEQAAAAFSLPRWFDQLSEEDLQ